MARDGIYTADLAAKERGNKMERERNRKGKQSTSDEHHGVSVTIISSDGSG